MNFYHVPSFEDNFTMKIWLKNWNLKINKALFLTIHNINRFFNSKVGTALVREKLPPGVLENLFPYHKWPEEPLKFHVFLKEEYDLKEETESQFYRKMHFLVFIIVVEGSEEEELRELQNSLKKFAFLSNVTATMTIAICKTPAARELFAGFPSCVTVAHLREVDEDCLGRRVLPIFLDSLRDKLKDIPQLDRNRVLSSQEDFVALTRKRPSNSSEAKLMKLRGDIALIFGSLADATNYFQKAREVFLAERKAGGDRKTGEHARLWTAGVQESMGACFYSQVKAAVRAGAPDRADLDALLRELVRACADSLAIYEQDLKPALCFELLLKMIAVFSLLKRKAQFIEFFFKLRNVLPQVSFDPRVHLYLGDLAHNAGLNRVAVCALFECSRQAKKGGELESVRAGCLSLCARILHLDLESYLNDFRMVELLPAEVTRLLLIGLIDASPHSHNNLKTLHYYLLLMKKFGNNDWVFREITQTVLWEFPLFESEYDVLPFVQRVVPVARPRLFQKLDDPAARAESERARVSESVFIYDPRTKSRFVELNWVAQEEAEVVLYLTNPLALCVVIDSVTLETEGVDAANYSDQISLSPFARNFEYKFKIRPVQAGLLRIRGVKIRIGNLVYLNSVDARGVSTIYKYVKADNPFIYEKFFLASEADLGRIPVAESVPCLDIVQRNFVPETIFYNENLQLEYRVTNFSKIKAEELRLSVKIDYENAPTVSADRPLPGFELGSSRALDVDFTLFQGRFAKSENFAFSEVAEGRVEVSYKNRSVVERVYKVTLRVESRFQHNREYIGVREFVRFFKNYRLLEARPTVIDFYGIGNLEFQDEYKHRDISDEVHLFFEVGIKFSNIADRSIAVALREKDAERELERIVLVDKNVLKFSDLKQNLRELGNLNQKYELAWELAENRREGIIQFDFPILLAVG